MARVAPAYRFPWPHILALAVFLSAPSPAAAQRLWGEIGLPGGASAARRVAGLGDPGDHLDSAVLLDFVRREVARGSTPASIEFQRYVREMEAIQAATGQWPDGFALPTLRTSKDERDKIERTLEALGLALRRRAGSYVVEFDGSKDAVQRIEWLKTADIDVASVVAQLNFGQRTVVRLRETALPLPIPDFWQTQVFEKGVLPILTIMRDRSAAFTYLGLLALDDETLTFLATRPSFVRRMGRDGGGALAVFGRSLRVRGGVVECPGGPDAANIWEQLVGRKTQDAEQFILSVLTKDGGRLAYFYDTVAHVPPARQRAALGLDVDLRGRLTVAKQVYFRFSDGESAWNVQDSPFQREGFDPAIVLFFIDVLPDGTIGPAWWASLLERISGSDDWPTRPQETVRDLRTQPANLGWLLGWVFEKPDQAQKRFQLVRFAQRVFHGASLGDAPSIEIALRSSIDLPMLPLALERMGLRDPGTYETVGRAARLLTRAANQDRPQTLAEWQSAMGLLEQIQRRVHLPEPSLMALLKSLAGIAGLREDDRVGAVGAWICDQLLPQMVALEPLDDLELRAIQAFSAERQPRDAPFMWEGLQYAVDRSGPASRDAWAIRQATHGARLRDLITLDRVRQTIVRGVKTLEDLKQVQTRLAAIEPSLAALPKVKGKNPEVVGNYHEVVTSISRLRRLGDLPKLHRHLTVIAQASDALVDVVVPSLLYALAVVPAPQPQLFVDAWTWHAMAPSSDAVTAGVALDWRHVAWDAPQTASRAYAGGTMLRGAYLTVDMAFGEVRLVRLASANPPPNRLFSDVLTVPIVQAVALAEGSSFGAPDPGWSATLEAGRRRVSEWEGGPAQQPDIRPALRRAGVDEWRANLMLWNLRTGLSRPFGSLRPSEIARLVDADAVRMTRGIPGASVDGCLCLLPIGDLGPEDVRGRRAFMMSILAADLFARLAEYLHEMKLPESLLTVLMPTAVQDWLDHIQMADADDWESVAAWPGRLTRDRVEDYLLFGISSGRVTSPKAAEGPVRR
jgi:hypothetical protein